MAKLLSSLLVAMVGCWLIMASSTEGAYFPFYYYGSSNSGPYLNADDSTADAVPVVINNYDSARLNRPISLFSSVPPGYITDDPTTINGRTFQAFANIFAGQGPFCRPCPTLNCPPPVTCPTCKACPVYPPTVPGIITLTISGKNCDVTDGITNVASAAAVGLCSRASSAPTGKIDVTFNAKYQAVIIAIVPVLVYPKTMVTLTCQTRTNVDVVTQNGDIASSNGSTKGGFIQLMAYSMGPSDGPWKLECDWTSS